MGEKSATCSYEIQDLKRNDGFRNICSLPETILEHILSFLPMKDAVRTSVLSKKWKFLWTSVPNLTFEEHSYSSRELFMNSIDRMLFLHNRYSIKHFSLDCAITYSESGVNTWVTAAVRRNVQKCTLRLIEVLGKFALPHCLFTCHTLMSLELDIRCTLRLPPEIHLPNLKFLCLQNVIFLDECSIQRLFCSPALEKLYIKYCRWVNLRAISISSPKLKHLIIDEYIASNDHHCCQVMICDCNLEHFDLSGFMFNEYSASNTSAVNVTLSSVDEDSVPDEALHHMIKILQEIHAVQKLCLFTPYGPEAADGRVLEQLDFPVFNALHTLELWYINTDTEVLGKLLQCTPHLHTLRVYKGIEAPLEEDYEFFDPVPPCFFSSLKKIIIGGLHSGEEELHVLKTMLQYAMVLEELVILSNWPSLDVRKLMRFARKLRGYPRGSKNCNIIVEI